MDWKLALTTFLVVFAAEMGDKTQLAVITMTASSGKPVAVMAGAIIALAAVTVLGVAAGKVAADLVSESVMRKIAAVLFMLIGLWTWIRE